jgi:hypothetical protein
MALTVSEIVPAQTVGADFKRAVIQVTLDNSYPTGGEALDLSGYGFTTVLGCQFLGDTVADNGYKFSLAGTRANGGLTASTCKICANWAASGTPAVFPEVTNTTDLSAVILTMVVDGV